MTLNWLLVLQCEGNTYTRKQIDNLIKWVKRPQIGAMGMVYCRHEDSTFKSSVDKFYSKTTLQNGPRLQDLNLGI